MFFSYHKVALWSSWFSEREGLTLSMMSSSLKLSYDTHPICTDKRTHLHNYWICTHILKIISLCSLLEWKRRLWQHQISEKRESSGAVSLLCFDCCETEGAEAHPREMEDVDERKEWEGGGWLGGRNSVRVDGEKTERVRTVQEENTPRPPLTPPLWNQIHWLTLKSSAYLEE